TRMPIVGMVRRLVAVVALAIERDFVGPASPWFVRLRGGTPVRHGFRLHLAHDYPPVPLRIATGLRQSQGVLARSVESLRSSDIEVPQRWWTLRRSRGGHSGARRDDQAGAAFGSMPPAAWRLPAGGGRRLGHDVDDRQVKLAFRPVQQVQLQ